VGIICEGLRVSIREEQRGINAEAIRVKRDRVLRKTTKFRRGVGAKIEA